MKRLDFLRSRKFRQGGVSVALTALVISLVILLNTLFGVLADRFYWGIDLSGGHFFTLTEYSKELLSDAFEKIPENRKVQNERYQKKNEELVESANLIIDEFNRHFSGIGFTRLTLQTYTKENIEAINQKIREMNASGKYGFSEIVYRELTPVVPENAKIKIIFCDDENDFEANELQRYVLETARQLRAEFPDVVELEFVNIYANPSAVLKYKTSTLTEIYPTDVIVESGNEYRHFTLDNFYIFESSSSTTVWAYNGEKKLASAILAVTQAEAPIAAVLLNHGETFYDDALLALLSDAGFIVQGLDLSREEIPEECRLILSYNPDKDFLASTDVGEGERSEITVLDEYLKRNNTSFMVFMSPSTPKLQNLEEFLELWGVKFNRYELEGGELVSSTVKEALDYSVTADGFSNIGTYVTEHLGGALTADMRKAVSPAKVIFRNTMPISYSEQFYLDRGSDDISGTADDRYTATIDGSSRFIYNVFTSSANALAVAGGNEVGRANSAEPYIYMTLSEDAKGYSEPVYTPDGIELEGTESTKTSSYVVTFSSVEFATAQYLNSSSYGNSEVLLRTLHEMGKDAVPVSLPIKPFENTNIEVITASEATAWTVVLALIPTITALVCGVYILVRRKNR